MIIDLFGSSEFCIPTAEVLLSAGYRLRCITAKLPSKHRSRTRIELPLKQFAKEHALLLKEVSGPKELRMIWTEDWNPPEAAVVASFGLLLPEVLLNLPRHQFLNIHPSLLPRHRGPSPVQWTLLEGDTTTGITIMLVDQEVDHGAILAQDTTAVNERETTPQLKKRLARLGAALLLETLPQWLNNTIAPTAQDHNKATWTRKLTRDDGNIRWSATAVEIDRRTRAFDPWPGSWTTWGHQGAPMIVKLFYPSVILRDSSSPPMKHPPGSILGVENHQLQIQCGNATNIGFREIQIEGKRQMKVDEFLIGTPTLMGSVFGQNKTPDCHNRAF